MLIDYIGSLPPEEPVLVVVFLTSLAKYYHEVLRPHNFRLYSHMLREELREACPQSVPRFVLCVPSLYHLYEASKVRCVCYQWGCQAWSVVLFVILI